MFEAAIDGLDGSVRGVHVEVGEIFAVPLPQRQGELGELSSARVFNVRRMPYSGSPERPR